MFTIMQRKRASKPIKKHQNQSKSIKKHQNPSKNQETQKYVKLYGTVGVTRLQQGRNIIKVGQQRKLQYFFLHFSAGYQQNDHMGSFFNPRAQSATEVPPPNLGHAGWRRHFKKQ